MIEIITRFSNNDLSKFFLFQHVLDNYVLQSHIDPSFPWSTYRSFPLELIVGILSSVILSTWYIRFCPHLIIIFSLIWVIPCSVLASLFHNFSYLIHLFCTVRNLIIHTLYFGRKFRGTWFASISSAIVVLRQIFRGHWKPLSIEIMST